MQLHHFCILHGSEVTLFNDMPITRVWSYIIELAQVCARYVNGQRDQVWRTLGQQWKERQGTNSNACGGQIKGLKSVEPQNYYLLLLLLCLFILSRKPSGQSVDSISQNYFNDLSKLRPSLTICAKTTVKIKMERLEKQKHILHVPASSQIKMALLALVLVMKPAYESGQ